MCVMLGCGKQIMEVWPVRDGRGNDSPEPGSKVRDTHGYLTVKSPRPP